MDVQLSEEQKLLRRRSALLRDRYTFETRRKIVATERDGAGELEGSLRSSAVRGAVPGKTVASAAGRSRP